MMCYLHSLCEPAAAGTFDFSLLFSNSNCWVVNSQVERNQTAMHEKFATIYKILTIIMAKPESEAFVVPVDWKGMQLLDYPEIVKCEF